MKNVKLMLCFCIAFSCLSVNKVEAQFKIDREYSSKTIYLKGNKYVKDGLEYPQGFFQSNMKTEMEISSDAVIEFGKFQKKRNSALLLSGAALATIFIAPNLNNDNARIGTLIGGLGLSLVSIPLSIKSNNHFQKAIWIRNRDALKM